MVMPLKINIILILETDVRRVFAILIAHIDQNAAFRQYLIDEYYYEDDGIAALTYVVNIEQDDLGKIPRIQRTQRREQYAIRNCTHSQPADPTQQQGRSSEGLQ